MSLLDACIVADEQLRYSIETWTCQLQDFVNDVIQQPVYLAGNSLGGLLSAHLAATQAHLCKYGTFASSACIFCFVSACSIDMAHALCASPTSALCSVIAACVNKPMSLLNVTHVL